MFGFFGKSNIENESFNNLLISCLEDCVRQKGRLPTEAELFDMCDFLAGKLKVKLNPSQLNAIRGIAQEINLFSTFSNELLPLLKQGNMEMKTGERKAYDALRSLLIRYALIYDDAMSGWMKSTNQF